MMNKNDDVNFDDVGWIIGEEENKNQRNKERNIMMIIR